MRRCVLDSGCSCELQLCVVVADCQYGLLAFKITGKYFIPDKLCNVKVRRSNRLSLQFMFPKNIGEHTLGC